ncbi:MAG: hypothetical protein KDM91_19630, partial [Verrucomicrobiae bacterium]|nr:hypothetical protein [Verrucomicrobiae bacterium]
GAVILTGGQGEYFDAGDAYAQIGHGGRSSAGTSSGDISIFSNTGIAPAYDGIGVQLKAGTRNNNFTLIGHGGTSSRSGTGNGAAGMEGNSGDITVDTFGDVNLIGGVLNMGGGTRVQTNDDGNLYAQIGHGGFDADVSLDGAVANGNGIGHHGDIVVVSREGNVNVLAGDHLRSYLPSFAPTANVFDLLPDRNAASAGGRVNYAQIGHGGYEARGNHFGDITVLAGYDTNGVMTNAAHDSDVIVMGGLMTADQDAGQGYAQIGNGGRTAVGDQGRVDETITVRADGDILVQAGNGVDNYAMVGNGGTNARGDHAGDIVVTATGDLTVSGNQAGTAAATEGGYVFTGTDANNSLDRAANLLDSGNINLRNTRIVSGSVSIDVFNDAGVKIGTVSDPDGDGTLTVESDFTELVGGVQFTAGQQVGTVTNYNTSSTSVVTFSQDINPGADADPPNLVVHYQTFQSDRAFAQIGHGGYDADNPNGRLLTTGNIGDIAVTVGGNTTFRGGASADSYAQLGHGGVNTAGQNIGDITLNTGGAIRFLGGVGNGFFEQRAYAQLGHGGFAANGAHTGDIVVNAGLSGMGGITFMAGDTADNYVQLGHGGRGAKSGGNTNVADADAGPPAGFSGDITVKSVDTIRFQGGTTTTAAGNEDGRLYAQLGHGGYDADYTEDGATVLSATPVGHNGDIQVISRLGDIEFLAGDTAAGSLGNGLGRIHYAQLGHGGYDARGDHYGNIDVRAGVDENGAVTHAGSTITFAAGSSNDDANETYNYAQLGHGGAFARGDMGWGDSNGDMLADGDINVIASGDILATGGRFFDAVSLRNDNQRSYVQIGHGGFDADNVNPGGDAASILMPDGNLYRFDGYNVGGPTALERRGN